MDRRQFLRRAGQAGLVAIVGLDAARCAPIPRPPPSSVPPGPSGPAPSPSPSPSFSSPSAAPSARPRDTAIATENARPGTRGWIVPSAVQHGLSGFLSAASVAPGDRLALHVGAAVAFDVDWYRLGWYAGDGGRLVRSDRGLPALRGGPVTPDPVTGLVEAPWPSALEFDVPPDWPSGMYVAILRPHDPLAARSTVPVFGAAPFIVRASPGAVAPVLFVSAATTWQAYNAWGGADLYGASSAHPSATRGRRAVEIGFDRPYALAAGAGFQRRWELQFVRWQEREAREVAYAADVDLELHPEVMTGRRLIVFAGHHEYWSRPMRSALEGAIAGGTNIAFLSANEVYWQVRLSPSPLGPGRRVTCYKEASLDPVAQTQPGLTTCRWREPPVNDPEAAIVGQMYGHMVRRPTDWVVRGSGHWLYEGTGLRDGDRLVKLVGQEYDTFFPDLAPHGTVLLAQSPVDAFVRPPFVLGAGSAMHNATMYTADSGATVFAAGTFQWSWAIDEYGDRSYRGVATPYDERVVRMTRNLFDRLGDGPP